jgi:IMP dehydrogenase
MGALRTSMATCGYESIHDFQKAEIMLAPSIKTEGKSLQQAQKIGMG